MKYKKKKIARKVSLKVLKELIITETRKALYESTSTADTYIGCFFCEENIPTSINNTNSILDTEYITEDSGNIDHYYADTKKKRYKYEVWVYNKDDGYKPHVHVKGNNFETCVMLEQKQYFLLKRWHQPFQNNNIRDAFAVFMESKNVAYSDVANISNYNVAVGAWNSNSNRPRVKVNRSNKGSIIIPNYRELETK